jgi:FkbM family methyltransferase
MTLRRFLRPVVPHFLKNAYQKRVLANLKSEPDALRCRCLIKTGDRVVDVGANIGAYTKLLSEWVGPEGFVHSYEPIPETCSYLQNNVRKFGMGNVVVHNAAVSSRPGEVKMCVPSSNFYQARISSGGDIPVKSVCLDEEFSSLTCVSFIKCDAEGHERAVIEGAVKLIHRDHPAWLIETWDEAIIQRMRELGYKATKLEHDWLFVMDAP